MANEGEIAGVGIGFTPFETRTEVILELAQVADAAGYQELGVAEAMGHAAPLVLAEAAAVTERLELSSLVLSVWSRSPAVLAMTAIGLQRISGGRFVLGLGASTPPLVEGLHGVRWEDPIGRIRAVVAAVGDLLRGKRLPQPAEGARSLRLAVPAPAPIPLAMAALSPPSVRLTGELADRWLPFLWPRPHLAAGRTLLGEGAIEGAREALPAICPSVPLAVGPDLATAQRAAARWLMTYCTAMGPVYPRLLRERFDYGAEIDALLAANTDREVPVLPDASRRLAEDVLVLGTYDDIPAAAAMWTDAGADRVSLILPFGTAPEELHAAVLAGSPPLVATGAASR